MSTAFCYLKKADVFQELLKAHAGRAFAAEQFQSAFSRLKPETSLERFMGTVARYFMSIVLENRFKLKQGRAAMHGQVWSGHWQRPGSPSRHHLRRISHTPQSSLLGALHLIPYWCPGM